MALIKEAVSKVKIEGAFFVLIFRVIYSHFFGFLPVK